MADLRDCPVCGRPDPMPTVERAAIPIFQNVTYASAAAAAAAPRGRFVLATCRGCGFSYNGAFDPARIVYDENYDNHVASDAFRDYYRDLAAMLIGRFGIEDGFVYDVGCGKGEFLEILHGLAPATRAVGIDPSCTPREEGNFRLIQSRFSAALFAGDARLVLLRHVLEHLDQPVAFLKELNAAMPDAPLFIEVPDLDWILDNQAFWDFCYEHCNYFTMDSLARACREAGFSVEEQQRSFGGQYQWILCRPRRDDAAAASDPREALAKVGAYAGREAGRIAALTEVARRRGGVAIWGMATKGVMLSNILPAGLVAGGVDMNRGKQGRFVAGSGVEVHGPDWLLTRPAESAVLVMNPNYAGEIAETARAIGADVVLETV
jgi:SAM-dependent methyltransferase